MSDGHAWQGGAAKSGLDRRLRNPEHITRSELALLPPQGRLDRLFLINLTSPDPLRILSLVLYAYKLGILAVA